MTPLFFLEWFSWTWSIVFMVLTYYSFKWFLYHRASDQMRAIAERNGMIRMKKEPIYIRMYRVLSWRKESRLHGWLANIHIPVFLRKPFFRFYISSNQIDMKDVEEQDLTKFSCVQEFFLRRLKKESRPIADNCLVSPADSYVYHFGEVDEKNFVIKEVKGFGYSLQAFFGEDICKQLHEVMDHPHKGRLWYFIGYLSPADCHWFISPTDWTLKFRRHFTGRLLSAVDSDMFDFNERMLITGEWKYGFFSMTAVGATDVGEIVLDFDERHTNIKRETVGLHDDRTYDPAVEKRKGEAYGHFEFGSVIVLVFEAPDNFEFTFERGDKLKYGQSIGKVA